MDDQRGGVVGEAVGDRRRSRRRHGYLAVSLVLTALYPALPGTAREVVLVAACGAATTCVVIGRRTVEPGRRAPWTLLLGARYRF